MSSWYASRPDIESVILLRMNSADSVLFFPTTEKCLPFHGRARMIAGGAMSSQIAKVPTRAWVVTIAGAACNLCLGILYAWSIWKNALVNKPKADLGEIMTGINAGWPYLTDSQGTFAYFVCGLFFAFFMIPGGRIQDKYGPKVGATVGGLCVALGCIIAGLMKSYLGLMIGFGVLGGIGMGIGYAAPTPAALKWFGPHKRGVISGIVVAGYGAAAIYIAPLASIS